MARHGVPLRVVEPGHRGLSLGLTEGDRGAAETHGGGVFGAQRVVGAERLARRCTCLWISLCPLSNKRFEHESPSRAKDPERRVRDIEVARANWWGGPPVRSRPPGRLSSAERFRRAGHYFACPSTAAGFLSSIRSNKRVSSLGLVTA